MAKLFSDFNDKSLIIANEGQIKIYFGSFEEIILKMPKCNLRTVLSYSKKSQAIKNFVP